MRHTRVAAAAFIAAFASLWLGASAQPACGQQAVVRLDTVQASAVQGREAPASVQSVRRRIRQIRGEESPRRVIYPYVILPSASAPAGRAPGAAPQGAPAPAAQVPAESLEPYYMPGRGDGLRNRRLFYDPSSGRVFVRNIGGGEGGEPEEEEFVPLPADSTVEVPEMGGLPTVRRIERAILETGLFQTSNVNFEFNESTLLPPAENTLDAVAEVLSRYPDLRVAVEGHTDAIGSEAYNQALSQRRAESVARYLAEGGVSRGRLEPIGYGEERPIATNKTPTGRTLNRRVSFRVLNPEAAEQYREQIEQGTELPADEERLREIIRSSVREEFERQRAQEEQRGGQESGTQQP